LAVAVAEKPVKKKKEGKEKPWNIWIPYGFGGYGKFRT